MTSERTGQVWAYIAGVFVVTGPATSAAATHGLCDWIDHPIVWLDDPMTFGRSGKADGFLEYHKEPWEFHGSFKRIT